MATLTNTQISVTYVGLLKTSGNTILDSTPQQITDGSGNNSQLFLSTAKVGIGATPSGSDTLQVQGSISITGDGSNATTLTESGSGDFTIDVAGDLSLDADGGDILFKDAGTTIGTFSNSSTDFVIQSNVSDKDIIFKGNDDGSTISPLTIDMSESGRALFNTGGENLVATFTSTDSIAEIRVADNSNYSRILNVGTQLKLMPNDGVELLILDGNDNTINVPDSKTLTFGDSDDLQISHNGSNTLITNNTGNILFTQNADDGDIAFYSDDGSGGVAEYFKVDGGSENVLFSKIVKLGDNVELRIGDGNDLKLFSDGSNGYVSGEQGDLYIRNRANDKDIFIQCDDGSDGVATYLTIDGSVVRTLVSKNFDLLDNVKLRIGTGDAEGAQDLQLYHNGSSSYIEQVGTGDLVIQQSVDDKDIVFNCDDGSGSVTEYFRVDGGDGKTIFSKESRFLDSVAIKLGTSGDLVLSHDGSNSSIQNFTGTFKIMQNLTDGDISFQSDDGSGGVTEYFRVDGGAEANIFSKKVGIGTSSPGGNLHVVGDSGSSGQIYVYDADNGTGTGDSLLINKSGTNAFVYNRDNGQISFGTNDTSDMLVIANDGSATFAGKVITTEVESSGALLLDATADITIDAGGQDIILSDDGVIFGTLSNSSGFQIRSRVDNADMFFRGVDDGTEFNALTLDMSAGGNATFAGNVSLGDSKELRLGASDDLVIKHNGTNSVVDNTTGDLIIQNQIADGDIIFKSDDGSDGLAEYFRIDGGSVKNIASKELQFFDNVKAEFGDSSDLEIYHDGSNSYIQDTGTGNLLITGSDSIQLKSAGDEFYIFCSADGQVALYNNGVKKFETSGTGVAVTGGMTLSGNVEGRKIPFVFRSSFDDSAGSTSIFVIPFDANVETTVSGADEEHIIIAPYAGELTKVQWKHVKGTLDTGFTTELFLYVNGSQQTSSGELTASSDAITWSPTSSNTFSAGDELMIAYQKSATSKDWEHVSVSVVFSFTGYNI